MVGIEKSAGDVTVYVFQGPISPLVGEKVKLTFALRDKSVKIKESLSEQNLKNHPVTLSVIDTFFGDESKDKKIYKKEFRTDANGNFSFEYTFDKENYFDIDLDFKDNKGVTQEVGFLIQPREAGQTIVNEREANNSENLLLIALGIALGILGSKLYKPIKAS
jgi:hypothetical protein